MGAPFHVRERASGRKFLAQLKPIDDTLKRNVDVHNALEQDNCEQFHTVVKDEAGRLALVVYENATGPLLGSLTHPGVSLSEPKGEDRERIVQIFVRQLLLALEHLHSMKIAHLDLRPESILLQDNKLKLADFGQSRRLLRGLITGRIEGSPEFVSPEIVRSLPLTLATDLWSVGTLTYVLLTGISPFLGDNDKETLKNVDDCRYSVDSPEFADFSWEAKDFIKNLLQEVPIHRLTCEQALMHPWIADGNLKNAPLPAEGLREFNYKHKWLERRVFVQQTPSEQLLAAITAPSAELAEQSRIREKAADPARPREYYDYLRVKPRGPAPVEDIPKRKVEHPPFIDEFGNVIDPKSFDPSIDLTQQIIDRYGPNSRAHPALDDQPERPNNRQIPQPWDRKGAPRPQEEQQPIRVPLDQYGRLFRPEDLARIPHDQHGRPIDLDDSKFPPLPAEEQYGRSQDQRPPPPDYMPQSEKRKLVPQDKGETPSKTLCRESPRAPAQDSEEPTMQIPLRMIRGERRDIEEEIANRILSDISEEGSLAGSLASIEELENPIKQYRERRLVPRSRSSTPRAESDASTPTLSPVNTVKEGDHFFAEEQSDEEIGDNYKPQSGGLFKVTPGRTIEDPDNPHYQLGEIESLPFDDQQALARLEEDETIPVGAPLFLEGLHGNNLVIDTKDLTPSPRSSAKSPRRCKPGTKSAVILSPGKEHSMEVLIAMKRGKPEFLPPGEQAPAIDDDDAHMDDRKKKVKASKHDSGFRDLRDELGDNNYRKKVENDLDRFRPSHFYKDDAFDRPDYDIDDSPWDSHYQIGPDTYLMAARGPSFNSRVRDYRRNLWGEGAPLVKQGILGVRNMDISVRERRRYTDILRETQQGVEPKSNEHINAVHKAPSASAIERIRADIEKVAPSATKRNADGTYAPIFISRLRDAYLGKSQALFECACTGSPAPSVEWSFQGKSLEPSEHFHVEQSGSIYRLKVNSPAVFDLGEYACVATNEFGTEKTSARLISGETPRRPGRPDAQLSSDTELFLTWDPPEGPCYLEGITYRIEYRPAGSDQVGAPWIVISDSVDDEAVVVKHLEPKGVYQFRVTARNAVGLGLPSLTSRIVQTHHRGVPKLQVDAIKHEIRLNVITLPQRSARQLNEISEESESEQMTVMENYEQVDVEEKLPTTTVELQNKNPTARFQLESLLFKGKFALIRQAVDIETEGNSQCIAKISDEKQKQSLEEYKLLRDGQHENVQKLIAAYQYDGFMYLFCERLYEDVFARFIFNDYYTEECVSMTIRQLCSAIHWLHFRGIAHLDVNPHNVMFQSKRNWIVKLVDFGSAQRLSEASKPEEFAVEWAAPEFHVQNTPVTVQSDVWGMGVVCFCLLGGFHPFTSEYDRPEEVKDNVLNVKCDPNLIPVCASQESLSFVTWALKKSPLRRMRTDEALSHKFLSTDPSMVRRREAIKYSASRLRKTAMLTKQEWTRPLSDQVEHKFGGPTVQP